MNHIVSIVELNSLKGRQFAMCVERKFYKKKRMKKPNKMSKCLICRKKIPKKEKACVSCLQFLDSVEEELKKSSLQLPIKERERATLIQKLDLVEKKIKSLFEEQGDSLRNRVTIHRKKLPKIFDFDLLEISKSDGLPIFKLVVIKHFWLNEISTIYSDDEVRFEKFENIYAYLDKIDKLEEKFKRLLNKKIKNKIKIKPIVTLSYFHHKIGPIVFYSYPKNMLNKELSVKIANIMDQQFSEDFFTHSFENLKSMNYYFEIHSDWARGNKEMLMVSIILDKQIPPEIEDEISFLLKTESERLQSNEEIFKAFYINEINNFDDNEQENIVKNVSLLKAWIYNLCWTIIAETRNKTEEQIIDLLLNMPSFDRGQEIEIHDDDYGDNGDLPFPYIRKPPSPPGDLGLAGEPQVKEPIIKQVLEYEPYCKHCGAELPKGQSICHVCGKRVD
jgi:hypothetical protein